MAGPAVGLIASGAFGAMLSVAGIFVNTMQFTLTAPRPSFHPTDTTDAMAWGVLTILVWFLFLLIAALVIMGGRMKGLQNHALAKAAAVLALLPCSPCCVIGLPVGIWALIVLAEPDVQAAFYS